MKRVLVGLASAAAIAGGSALAADVAPYYRAPPVAVVVPYTWTGFYAGANVGGAWTDTNALWTPLPTPAAFGIFPTAGNTGGSSAIGGIPWIAIVAAVMLLGGHLVLTYTRFGRYVFAIGSNERANDHWLL